MNRKRYRAPSTGRREGAPSGKSGKREKGKRLPGPDSPRRDKRLFDDGGGAPQEVPEASMRGIRLTPAAEPRIHLSVGVKGNAWA